MRKGTEANIKMIKELHHPKMTGGKAKTVLDTLKLHQTYLENLRDGKLTKPEERGWG